MITNATSSAKRWFHREGQGVREHMGFILLHFIQLALVSWLYLSFDLLWIAVAGGYLLVASLIIIKCELYLQRPVAMILYCVSLIISLYLLEAPAGLEWFLPVFYVKLLISHLIKEEPYRLADESC